MKIANFYLMVILPFIFWTARYLINPIFPLYLINIGATKFQIGIIIAIPSLICIFTRVLFGFALSKYGGWKIIFYALLAQIISFFLYFLINNPLLLYLVAIIDGLSYSSFGPTGMELSIRFSRINEKNEVIGKYLTSIGFGMVLGPLLCSILTSYFTYNKLFLISAFFTIFGLLFLFFATKENYFSRKDMINDSINYKNIDILSSLKNIIKNKNLMLLYISTLLFAMCQGVYNTLFSIHSKNNIGLNDSIIAFLFTINGLSNALIRIPSGKIISKFSKKKIILIGMVLISLMFFIISITNNILLLLLAMVMHGIGWGMRAVATTSMVSESTPEVLRGIALNIFWNMFDIGAMIGAMFGGSLASFLYMNYIFSICCIIILIGIILVILVKEK
ncbi:MAG: MFS transporter [Nitrososphaerota archaeon]